MNTETSWNQRQKAIDLLFRQSAMIIPCLPTAENKKLVDTIFKSPKNEKNTLIKKYLKEYTPKYTNLSKLLNSFKSKIEYKGSGTTGHVFHAYTEDDHGNKMIEFSIKVTAYRNDDDYADIYDEKRPENAELRMHRLLGLLVLRGSTPHINLAYSIMQTNLDLFTNLPIEDQKYKDFKNNAMKNEYHPIVSVLFSEWANKGDFLSFLREDLKPYQIDDLAATDPGKYALISDYTDNKPTKLDILTDDHWRVILFQILSCLATIHEHFPEFRHNDLKANNILVQRLPPDTPKRFFYEINKQYYTVPAIGIIMKLWDFDFSCIPGIIDNWKTEKEWAQEKYNIRPIRNQYYDMFYLFKTLGVKGLIVNFNKRLKLSAPETYKFIQHIIIPDEIRELEDMSLFVNESGRVMTNKEYFTPDQLLRTNSYFEPFRTDKSIDVSTITMSS